MAYALIEGDRCLCTWGYLIAKGGYLVCSDCGGAITPSGKYLPTASGWTLPVLNDDDRAQADERIQARIMAERG